MIQHMKNAQGNEYIKVFYQLIQCIHHAAVLCPQTSGNFSKTFKNKIDQLNLFICPALSNDEIQNHISETNKKWAASLTSNIRDHYLKNKEKISKQIKGLSLPHHIINIVMEKALHRARKNFGKKLANSAISEFKNLCQTWRHPTNENTKPNHEKPQRTNHTETTRFVRGYTNPLSNFFFANFTFQGIVYKTVEHAFNHQKALYFDHHHLADEVYSADKPYKARTITSQIKKTTNWLNSRTKLMYDILKAKYQQVTSFRNEINISENMEIIHNVVDPFWGSGKEGNGLNKYGKLLTQLTKDKPETYAECVKSPNRNKTNENSKPCTTSQNSPNSDLDTTDLPGSKPTPSNRFENSGSSDQTPHKQKGDNQKDSPKFQSKVNNQCNSPSVSKRVLRPRKQQEPECMTTVRTIHKKTKNKEVDWQLCNISNDTLILGDSNLTRIEKCDMIPNTQIEAFPGAQIQHITTIVSKYPENQPKPKRVILSVGINNRDCNFARTKQDCKEMFAKIKQKFPKCEIVFSELNFSGKLSIQAKRNLASLNKFVQSHEGVTNIPPIDKSHFRLTGDNIHWTPKTAKHMINWWSQNLNF